MRTAGRAAAWAAAGLVALGAAGCSTSTEDGIKAPTAQARAYVDQAALGFQDAFRREPGQPGVDRMSRRLGAETTGSDRVVVLSSAAEPTHGEIGLAVYSRADGARDGDPFGHWTVRMCVSLVADGTTDATVTVERLECPDVADPPFADVDATVDY